MTAAEVVVVESKGLAQARRMTLVPTHLSVLEPCLGILGSISPVVLEPG